MEEPVEHGGIMSLQRGVEAPDRVVAALGVRIIGGEHVEPRIALAGKQAHVLEGVGGEPQLLARLLGREPLEAGQAPLNPVALLRQPPNNLRGCIQTMR